MSLRSLKFALKRFLFGSPPVDRSVMARINLMSSVGLSDADRIWNRAALESGGASPGAGDRALAAMLLAHGLIMNGGVKHALEALAPAERADAAAGFRFFSLIDAAVLIEDSGTADLHSNEADERYWALVPNDDVLEHAFRTLYAASPSAFSPIIESENT